MENNAEELKNGGGGFFSPGQEFKSVLDAEKEGKAHPSEVSYATEMTESVTSAGDYMNIAVDELRYKQLLQERYRLEAHLKELKEARERSDALDVKTGENVVESLSGRLDERFDETNAIMSGRFDEMNAILKDVHVAASTNMKEVLKMKALIKKLEAQVKEERAINQQKDQTIHEQRREIARLTYKLAQQKCKHCPRFDHLAGVEGLRIDNAQSNRQATAQD